MDVVVPGDTGDVLQLCRSRSRRVRLCQVAEIPDEDLLSSSNVCEREHEETVGEKDMAHLHVKRCSVTSPLLDADERRFCWKGLKCSPRTGPEWFVCFENKTSSL